MEVFGCRLGLRPWHSTASIGSPEFPVHALVAEYSLAAELERTADFHRFADLDHGPTFQCHRATPMPRKSRNS